MSKPDTETTVAREEVGQTPHTTWRLPLDLVVGISLFLDPVTVSDCLLVCRHFDHCWGSAQVWERLLLRDASPKTRTRLFEWISDRGQPKSQDGLLTWLLIPGLSPSSLKDEPGEKKRNPTEKEGEESEDTRTPLGDEKHLKAGGMPPRTASELASEIGRDEIEDRLFGPNTTSTGTGSRRSDDVTILSEGEFSSWRHLYQVLYTEGHRQWFHAHAQARPQKGGDHIHHQEERTQQVAMLPTVPSVSSGHGGFVKGDALSRHYWGLASTLYSATQVVPNPATRRLPLVLEDLLLLFSLGLPKLLLDRPHPAPVLPATGGGGLALDDHGSPQVYTDLASVAVSFEVIRRRYMSRLRDHSVGYFVSMCFPPGAQTVAVMASNSDGIDSSPLQHKQSSQPAPPSASDGATPVEEISQQKEPSPGAEEQQQQDEPHQLPSFKIVFLFCALTFNLPWSVMLGLTSLSLMVSAALGAYLAFLRYASFEVLLAHPLPLFLVTRVRNPFVADRLLPSDLIVGARSGVATMPLAMCKSSDRSLLHRTGYTRQLVEWLSTNRDTSSQIYDPIFAPLRRESNKGKVTASSSAPRYFLGKGVSDVMGHWGQAWSLVALLLVAHGTAQFANVKAAADGAEAQRVQSFFIVSWVHIAWCISFAEMAGFLWRWVPKTFRFDLHVVPKGSSQSKQNEDEEDMPKYPRGVLIAPAFGFSDETCPFGQALRTQWAKMQRKDGGKGHTTTSFTKFWDSDLNQGNGGQHSEPQVAPPPQQPAAPPLLADSFEDDEESFLLFSGAWSGDSKAGTSRRSTSQQQQQQQQTGPLQQTPRSRQDLWLSRRKRTRKALKEVSQRLNAAQQRVYQKAVPTALLALIILRWWYCVWCGYLRTDQWVAAPSEEVAPTPGIEDQAAVAVATWSWTSAMSLLCFFIIDPLVQLNLVASWTPFFLELWWELVPAFYVEPSGEEA